MISNIVSASRVASVT